MSSQNSCNCRVAELSRYRARAAIKKLLRIYNLFKNEILLGVFQGPFNTALRTPVYVKKGSFVVNIFLYQKKRLNTGKYWLDKKHCFSNKHHRLTQYNMQKIMYAYLLHFFFFHKYFHQRKSLPLLRHFLRIL